MPIPGDWYPGGLPANMEIGNDVYIDSSYGFASFFSVLEPGLRIGDSSGVYDRTALVVGPRGLVSIGSFTVLNGTYIICEERIDIGSHCLLAWGVTIADSWFEGVPDANARRAALLDAARDPLRHPPSIGAPRPVIIEDNVWVGFDSVILPGVRLGRGCIVGCKSVVYDDVPPYAVVAGDPAKVIRRPLEPDDSEAARSKALADLTLPR